MICMVRERMEGEKRFQACGNKARSWLVLMEIGGTQGHLKYGTPVCPKHRRRAG